jgi:hypothetical protein
MIEVSDILKDSSGNGGIMFQNPASIGTSNISPSNEYFTKWTDYINDDNKPLPIKLYGISGESYLLKTANIVGYGNVPFIGYDSSMSFFDTSGKAIYISEKGNINNETNIKKLFPG